MADDQWHHVTATWRSDTGHIKLFCDGVLLSDEKDAMKGRAIPGGGSMILGQQYDHGGGILQENYFHGLMTAFNMWNRVLSEETIGKLATALEGIEAGNVLSWQSIIGTAVLNVQVTKVLVETIQSIGKSHA